MPALPSDVNNFCNTVKPVYKGPVYSGHSVYHGNRTTSQKSFLMSRAMNLLMFTVKLTCI